MISPNGWGYQTCGGARVSCVSFVDGYGLSRRQRARLVEDMIEVAVGTAAQEAVDAGVSPNATRPAAMGLLGGGSPLQGHELLWAMTWRTRSAAWMLRHRRTLAHALR
jgi:hypothetical protein